MAIIIPSKNIYEINNQKVIDNEVDNVEVGVKNASIISDTKIVYNERINSSAKNDNKQSHYTHNERTYSGMGTQNYTAVAYVEETPKYDTVTITIPKHIGNAGVLRILTGANEDGIENIKYSLRGTTKKGNVTGTSVCASSVVSGVSFESIALNEPTNVETKTDTQYSFSPNVDYAYDFHFAGAEKTTVSATENFVLSNKSNILTAQTRDSSDGQSFIIDLIFLSGTIIKKVGGGGLYVLGGSTNIRLSGEYEEYIPTQIDVSFYGDTISLDLQDETVKIGDGQHVYSFNGNELMQKQNEIQYPRYGITLLNVVPMEDEAYIYCTYTHDSNEMDLIDGDIIVYNGELAYAVKKTVNDKDTILIAINPNGEFNKLVGIFSSTIVQRISQNQVESSYNEIIREWKNGKEVATLSCAVDDYYTHYGVKEIDKSGKTGKMLFSIGDIVVPYIFGANGKEIPMSKYKDGLPKQFKIIKSGVQYSGSPRSEILIQEIPFEKRESGVR